MTHDVVDVQMNLNDDVYICCYFFCQSHANRSSYNVNFKSLSIVNNGHCYEQVNE